MEVIEKILAGEAEWKKRVKDLKLGKGTHGTLAAHGTCSKGKRYLQSKSKGKQRLKVWPEKERSMCHHVDKTDLVEEFIELCEDEFADVQQEKKRRQCEAVATNTTAVAVKAHEDRIAVYEGGSAVTFLQGYELLEKNMQTLSNNELVLWEGLLKNRVGKLSASKKYFETFGSKLLVDLGAKLLQQEG